MSKFNKIKGPANYIIEKTALELAACAYEAGRSNGLTSRFPDARKYAHANLERFIPLAIQTLLKMLNMDSVPENQKEIIYEAIMERHNDEETPSMFPDFDPFMGMGPPKAKPIIVNTTRIEDALKIKR